MTTMKMCMMITKNKKQDMKYLKSLNENKIANAIQNAIDEYYMEDNFDSIETISRLTGLDYDLVVTTLEISTQENAMENLMEH